MIIGNKYYFLGTDLFPTLRLYIYSTLILVSIFVFVHIDIRIAIAITSSILTLLLILDSGFVIVDIYNKNIVIKNIYGKIVMSSIDPYEFWWNYEFDHGKIIADHAAIERRWKSRSNKVIVNLVLKNRTQRIRFKETIMLDTRHPNDAIYLEEYNNENTSIFYVQRIDKLMIYLQDNLKESEFTIDQKYRK